MLSKSTLAFPELREVMESLMPVIDVLIVPIAAVCSPTVVCNVLTSLTKPLSVSPTVVCNVLIAFVLSLTLVFKLPTVIVESAPPSLTSFAILPELIVAPVRVALLSVAPSDFAYALNALNTVPPDTAFPLFSAISPSG